MRIAPQNVYEDRLAVIFAISTLIALAGAAYLKTHKDPR